VTESKKSIYWWVAFLVAFGASSAALGESRIDLSSTGLNGVVRVGIPTASSPQINLAGTAGYGLTESLGTVDGNHHRLFGRLALGAHVAPWLALALSLNGRFDRHPRDDQGIDYGGTGDPRLLVRAGGALGELFQLGGEVELWVPGGEAPSMEWAASTVDFKLLPALAPHGGPWFVGLLAGFRLDQSAAAAPQLESLRQGDRIALGLSEDHSVLLGLAGTYSWSRTQLLAEVSWDLLVGGSVSSPLQCPIRADLGVRQAFVDKLIVELLAEVGLSQRPGVGSSDPLVPIEPRFSVSLGLRYSFDLRKKDTAEADSELPLEQAPPNAAVTATVSGTLVDPSGAPVPGVELSLRLEDGTVRLATTDSAGGFAFDSVPRGRVELRANEPRFEQGVWDFVVDAGPLVLGQRTLHPVEGEPLSSQLRGLVRSFSGEKIPAKVTVEPIGAELTCQEDGTFQLDVPPGAYEVHVRAPGFLSQTRKVVVEENGVSILNIDLRSK
jgi:hypothetical protein